MTPKPLSDTVHGTCVALGGHAALLRGDSGAGKSDLALRFLNLPAAEEGPSHLVADDQVCLTATNRGLEASPPAPLAGLMEVRGLGILPMPFIATAQLVLVCDLTAAAEVPRMPPEPLDRIAFCGVPLPLLKLAPFEDSAPLKLRLALIGATTHLHTAEQ